MHFRETHVSFWPDQPLLDSVLLRLRGLLPPNLQTGIQTHILHLASNGHILPHVDNTEASGSWIASVSLGGERVLRMNNESDKAKSFDILLPSGSVYVQRYDTGQRQLMTANKITETRFGMRTNIRFYPGEYTLKNVACLNHKGLV